MPKLNDLLYVNLHGYHAVRIAGIIDHGVLVEFDNGCQTTVPANTLCGELPC